MIEDGFETEVENLLIKNNVKPDIRFTVTEDCAGIVMVEKAWVIARGLGKKLWQTPLFSE
ncbi:hypothetical protein LQZ18_15265 [Lachnospiraceae bacterium ZAX-1]